MGNGQSGRFGSHSRGVLTISEVSEFHTPVFYNFPRRVLGSSALIAGFSHRVALPHSVPEGDFGHWLWSQIAFVAEPKG